MIVPQNIGRERIVWKRALLGLAFTMPALTVLFVFSFWPFVQAMSLAFYRSNGLGSSEFVGLNNFLSILGDGLFWKSMAILGLFGLLMVPLETVGPLIGAKLINSVRNQRASFIYRTIFVLPLVIPMVVLVLVWRNIYSIDGALNRILGALGATDLQTAWLGNTSTVIPAIVAIGIPFVGGVNLLIYLAGMLNISKSVYEAADLEGASLAQVFWMIELPLLRPQVGIVLALSLIKLIHSYEHILVLTNGGPANATLVPALYLFRNGFEFGHLGYASAVGVILFCITLVLTLINLRLTRRMD